ncbi:MAG: VCBS repeat-containing protein [Sedimentisphaerales bacterium]|nr:VCBS repeat-containing protein [Sedimentisphaerales bacterium]
MRNMKTYKPNHRTCLFVLVFLTLICTAAGAFAADVEFVMHQIGSFRSEACGVADFNRDWKPDIIAGSFWYENPTWKPHRFRSLEDKLDLDGSKHAVDEDGKGYRDDFANIPLDIDGDGLTDLVTCSWFSKRFDWYRNTGKDDAPWPITVFDEGVNFETGDIADIDGDGNPREILPHCQDTRWYEIAPGPDRKPALIRHIVATKNLNFGGGVGDINGDARPDIIRPDAWYEAPPNPRTGEWKEHPIALGSLEEGKAEHTPQIFVYDVDADGYNDIITSSAHGYGIFWYRQIRRSSTITFEQRIIDKSWSQAHSLALADLDLDGDPDLLAGKRFYAHNGADPGAEEPLVIYWYELEKPGKWTRHTISAGQKIGSALHIPVFDFDKDGDWDFVVTGKFGGPVLFENKLR